MNIGYIFIVYLNMPFRWCITHADPLTRSEVIKICGGYWTVIKTP